MPHFRGLGVAASFAGELLHPNSQNAIEFLMTVTIQDRTMLTARDLTRLANDGANHVSEGTKRGAHRTDLLLFNERMV